MINHHIQRTIMGLRIGLSKVYIPLNKGLIADNGKEKKGGEERDVRYVNFYKREWDTILTFALLL